MEASGQIQGLIHQYEKPLQYFLTINEENIHLNPYIGSTIKIVSRDEINCIHCGRKIKKTYNNGFCYPCFKKLPQNDLCIVKPNLCHFDEGTCRDEAFGTSHCMIPHYVYLALSSDVKVGITRKANELKRWGDQGAVQAIPLAEVPTRKIAGELEVALAQHLPDKTNWRNMLKGTIAEKDLLKVWHEVKTLVPENYQSYLLDMNEIFEFIYPVQEFPEKIKSLNLDKNEEIEGRLMGIKGQYIILDIGVFNIKKHTGYFVDITFL